MTRRFIILGLPGAAIMSRGVANENFDAELVDFYLAFDKFCREYWGCSKTAHEFQECVSTKHFDYKLWKDACRKAKIFGE